MNILFLSNVLPTPWRPSQGAFNAELIRALRIRGHSVFAIAPVPWLQLLRRPLPIQVVDSATAYPTFWYPPGCFRAAYDRWMWWSIRRSASILGGLRPDVVIAFWVHPDGSCAVKFARSFGVPSLVIAGGSDLLVVPDDAERAARIGETLLNATAVLAEGEHLVAAALRLGADPARTHVFRRGVDQKRFGPGDQSEARARLGLPSVGKILLWAGNMVRVKNVELLLDAHALMSLHKPELVLIGDGPLRRELELHATRNGTGRVHFAGRIPHQELAEWYRAADVFVLPSLSEGTPNVLQEASACGIPFVAMDVGAIRSLAMTGDRVVQERTPKALAAAIDGVLNCDGLRHGKVPFAYSWDQAVDQIESVLAIGAREN